MKNEKIQYFKDLLTDRLGKLIKEAEKTVNGMTTIEEDTFPDPTDRASLETGRNSLLRIRDRERKLILKIQDALEKIESGTFGICDSCGENISPKRLEVRPVTTFCIECKRREEAIEKIKGL